MSILITPSAVSSGASIVSTYNRQGKDIGTEPIEEFFIIYRVAVAANSTNDFIYGNDSDYMILSVQSNVVTPNITFNLLTNASALYYAQSITAPYTTYTGLLVPKGFILRTTIPTVNTAITLVCKQCSVIERIVL